jgi:hypothetical protein
MLINAIQVTSRLCNQDERNIIKRGLNVKMSNHISGKSSQNQATLINAVQVTS